MVQVADGYDDWHEIFAKKPFFRKPQWETPMRHDDKRSREEIRQWLCAVESCSALYETRNGKSPTCCVCGSQLFKEKVIKGN